MTQGAGVINQSPVKKSRMTGASTRMNRTLSVVFLAEFRISGKRETEIRNEGGAVNFRSKLCSVLVRGDLKQPII